MFQLNDTMKDVIADILKRQFPELPGQVEQIGKIALDYRNQLARVEAMQTRQWALLILIAQALNIDVIGADAPPATPDTDFPNGQDRTGRQDRTGISGDQRSAGDAGERAENVNRS